MEQALYGRYTFTGTGRGCALCGTHKDNETQPVVPSQSTCSIVSLFHEKCGKNTPLGAHVSLNVAGKPKLDRNILLLPDLEASLGSLKAHAAIVHHLSTGAFITLPVISI